MKFKVGSRPISLKKNDPPKYYAFPVNTGVVDLYEFASDLAGRSSLLSLSSKGAETSEEFHVSMIKGVKVIFTPDTRMKKELSDTYFEHTNK